MRDLYSVQTPVNCRGKKSQKEMEQSDRSDNRPKLMVKVDKLMVNGDKLMVKVDREAGRPGAVFEAEFLVDAATAGHAHAHHHLGSGASRAGYSHLSLLYRVFGRGTRWWDGLALQSISCLVCIWDRGWIDPIFCLVGEMKKRGWMVHLTL